MSSVKSSGSLLQVSKLEVDSTLLSLSWIPSSARIAALGTNAAGDGVVKVYSISGRGLHEEGSAQAGKPLRCGTLDVCDISERVLCCGDFSGNLILWDMESLEQIKSSKAHTDVVHSISGGGLGSNEILTGGREGEVKVWDQRELGSPVVRIAPEADETRHECWTVSHAGQGSRLVAAGYNNGDIKLFDVRKMKIIWETTVAKAVSSLCFIPGEDGSDWLVAGTDQGRLFKWDAKSPSSTVSSQLDKSVVWDTKVISDKSLLVNSLGSGGLSVCRYTRDSLEQVCSQQVSEPPLNALTVSRDKPGLIVTTSLDKVIHFYLYKE